MHCPSQKYGTVTVDFIINNVCGTIYGGIQMPTIEQITSDMNRLQQAETNLIKYLSEAAKQHNKKTLKKFSDENPDKVITKHLDLALFVLGVDIEEGYHLSNNKGEKLQNAGIAWGDVQIGSTVRCSVNKHQVYLTDALEVKLRSNYRFIDMWERNDFVLTSTPYNKTTVDVTSFGDWEEKEEEI